MVDHKLYGSRAEFDSTINTVLEEFGVELVCLAGFMRILTGTFVKKWNGMVIYYWINIYCTVLIVVNHLSGKLLNIHPSLLPSFKGVNAQKQALQAGVRVAGCTVHFVAVSINLNLILVCLRCRGNDHATRKQQCDWSRELHCMSFSAGCGGKFWIAAPTWKDIITQLLRPITLLCFLIMWPFPLYVRKGCCTSNIQEYFTL